MTVHALILAGGTGSRFGGDVPKQLLEVDGRTVFERSVAAFAEHPGVDDVVVVTHEASRVEAERIAAAHGRVTGVVAGGRTRADSTRAGLASIDGLADEDLVLVHDAARPWVSAEIIDACLAALDGCDAVTPALESIDTLVEVDASGVIARTLDRSRLRRVQTPQGFRAGVLRRAHAAAAQLADEPTDDCAVVLAHEPGARVTVVPGEERNLKITHPTDL